MKADRSITFSGKFPNWVSTILPGKKGRKIAEIRGFGFSVKRECERYLISTQFPSDKFRLCFSSSAKKRTDVVREAKCNLRPELTNLPNCIEDRFIFVVRCE